MRSALRFDFKVGETWAMRGGLAARILATDCAEPNSPIVVMQLDTGELWTTDRTGCYSTTGAASDWDLMYRQPAEAAHDPVPESRW